MKCSARAVICPECILLGDTTTLQIRVYEVEVSERKEAEKPPKKRLLSKTSVVKVIPERDGDVRKEDDSDTY